MTGPAEAARLTSPNPPFQYNWTPERTEKLKKLWKDGHTATEIATIMGEGLTRNSVLGKASRLKLGSRGERVRDPGSRITNRNATGGMAFKIARARQEHPDATAGEALAALRTGDPVGQKLLRGAVWMALPGTTPIPLVEVSDATCRWPIGEAPIMFCGAPVDGGRYCAHHYRTATGGKP